MKNILHAKLAKHLESIQEITEAYDYWKIISRNKNVSFTGSSGLMERSHNLTFLLDLNLVSLKGKVLVHVMRQRIISR